MGSETEARDVGDRAPSTALRGNRAGDDAGGRRDPAPLGIDAGTVQRVVSNAVLGPVYLVAEYDDERFRPLAMDRNFDDRPGIEVEALAEFATEQLRRSDSDGDGVEVSLTRGFRHKLLTGHTPEGGLLLVLPPSASRVPLVGRVRGLLRRCG